MPVTTILSALALAAPGFLASYFAKRELDKLLLNEQSLEAALQDVIQEAVLEYAETDRVNHGKKLPFYHSKTILDELVKFRLMSAMDHDSQILMNALENEKDIAMPSDSELSSFFALIIDKLKANKELKKLEIKEDFASEIFHISTVVKRIEAKMDQMAAIYDGELEFQWKDRVDAYVRTLEAFRPATALKLLEQLERSLQTATKQPGKNFMAFLHFQKGQCMGFLNRPDDACRQKLTAYEMFPNHLLYARHAAFCFLKLQDRISALRIARDIHGLAPFDPGAWAVEVLCADLDFEDKLSDVPQLVRQDLAFQRYLNNEMHPNYHKRLVACALVPRIERYREQDITIDNFNEAVFWINRVTELVYSSYFVDFSEPEPDVREEVKLYNRMLALFLDKLDGSEVVQDYSMLRFLFLSSSFMLVPSEEGALALEVAYKNLVRPTSYWAFITANALQVMNATERAVDLLRDCDAITTEGLLLLAFCYKKMEQMDNFVVAAKRYSASITDFQQNDLLMFLNLILEIKLLGVIEKFNKKDFIANKGFRDNDLEMLVTNYVSMVFDGAEAYLDYFDRIIENSTDVQLIGLIGSGFFAVDAFEQALPVLSRNLQNDVPGRELYQLIKTQHKLGKELHQLLVQLEHWRLHLPFNPEFLRMEAFLKRDLMDWDSVVEVCELYLGVVRSDSSMLAIYLTALHRQNTAASHGKITKLATELDDYSLMNPQHITIISGLLMSQGHNEKAMELIYPVASDPAQIEARGHYNWFVLRLPKESTICKEYKTVNMGHFVKFELNGKANCIEMDEKTLAHPLYKQFIGKTVGAQINHKRATINVTDRFVIKRIMDKFLSLFDQILEQATADPHAGLPFESIPFDQDHPGGILGSFEDLLGEQGRKQLESREQDFRSYYQGNISLSELIANVYGDDYITGYYNLIVYHEGIFSIPRRYFEKRSLDLSQRFVIDLSSLLLFHQMTIFHSTAYSQKFIISRYLVEQIKSKLALLEHSSHPFDLPATEWKKTAIQDDSFEFRIDRVAHLNSLLEWISQHCEVELSARTIDLVRAAEHVVGKDDIVDAAMSTTLLVQDISGRILISDDGCYTRLNMLSVNELTSCEDYIKSMTDGGNSADEFVRNRYINFSPSMSQLNSELTKRLANQYSNYELLLHNCTLYNSKENLATLQEFVGVIALEETLQRDQRIARLTNVFGVTLRDCLPEIIPVIRATFEDKFVHSGNKKELILSCFDDAWLLLQKPVAH